jgi:signal transduction histidine kinase
VPRPASRAALRPLPLLLLGAGLPLLALTVALRAGRRRPGAPRRGAPPRGTLQRGTLQRGALQRDALQRELAAARDEEAARIARELHDDVGQRLALVAIGLARLQRAPAGAAGADAPDAPDVAQLHAQLQRQAGEIADAVRRISHRLHPAALERVGLPSALRATCEEVRAATGLDVRFLDLGDAADVPRGVALCLFRVAQEALHNVVRHAAAHAVELSLRRDGATLVLQVTDDGRGLAVDALERESGLGLRSAAERVSAARGTLTVASRPDGGWGTTVRARVPLREAS